MKEILGDIFLSACKNPQALVITLLVAGFAVVYCDIREYISEQRKEQTALNDKFVDALNQIVYRLDKIETKLNIENK